MDRGNVNRSGSILLLSESEGGVWSCSRFVKSPYVDFAFRCRIRRNKTGRYFPGGNSLSTALSKLSFGSTPNALIVKIENQGHRHPKRSMAFRRLLFAKASAC